MRTICETVKTRNLRLLQPYDATWSRFSVGIKDELVKGGSQYTFDVLKQASVEFVKTLVKHYQ